MRGTPFYNTKQYGAAPKEWSWQSYFFVGLKLQGTCKRGCDTKERWTGGLWDYTKKEKQMCLPHTTFVSNLLRHQDEPSMAGSSVERTNLHTTLPHVNYHEEMRMSRHVAAIFNSATLCADWRVV